MLRTLPPNSPGDDAKIFTPPNLPLERGGAKLSVVIFTLMYDKFPLEKWDSCPLPFTRGGLGWGKDLRINSSRLACTP
jgi:hypothetical protein